MAHLQANQVRTQFFFDCFSNFNFFQIRKKKNFLLFFFFSYKSPSVEFFLTCVSAVYSGGSVGAGLGGFLWQSGGIQAVAGGDGLHL